MSRLPAAALADLSRALRDAYLKMPQLDEFLRTKLDRRVDDLTSRYLPLTDSIAEVVQKAQAQGWVTDLARAAAEDRPQNETLAKLLASLPSLASQAVLSPAKSQNDRPSLLCGRGAQWNEVCQCAPVRLHQVILVAGSRGQDSLHFRDRVQTWLTPDPSRTMRVIHWQTPPASLGEMTEALAVAFAASAETLSQAIADKLAYQNLVLLHPCLLQGFTQEHVVQYYTEFIPGLLAQQQTQGRLKCLQPIEWPISPQRGLLGRFWSGGEGAKEGRDSAVRLMTTLREKQAAHVRVLDVDELKNLERREIEQFLESSEFSEEHQKLLFDQLMTGPQVPGFMFKTIDEYWRGISGNS
jgi:hypothetical protein